MMFFVQILRIVIDIVMSRVFFRVVMAVMGLVGLSATSSYWITFFAFMAVILHPKTRVVYNLVREFIVHLVCKAISLVVKVPENLYGPRYAKGF